MKILITGVSGYIGSCLYFYLKNKFKVCGIDKIITKRIPSKRYDLKNLKKISIYLKQEKPDIIIHLAAQSLVDETINKKRYYLNNVIATKNLINAMKENNLNNLIFSSTAALYKYKNNIITETSKIYPKSTYAKTKYECEKMIKYSGLNTIILRFFNVCSSLKFKDKIIGELHDPETHLIPTIVYKNIFRKKIYIYGDNYKTNDGTCIRDYVHIVDICSAIKKSISHLLKNKNTKEILNIGSSNKITNLEILKKIQKITKINSNFEIVGRRKGDIDRLSCSVKKAKKILKWQPINSQINKIIKDEILWVDYLKRNKIKRKFKNYL